jgi:hypothetical protein
MQSTRHSPSVSGARATIGERTAKWDIPADTKDERKGAPAIARMLHAIADELGQQAKRIEAMATPERSES